MAEFPFDPRILEKTEGIVTFDAADYAPHAAKQLRAYYAKTGRKVYYAGPLIPQRQEDTSRDQRSEEVTKFLDEKLTSHGEGSLIYVGRDPSKTSLVNSDVHIWLDLLRIPLLASR